MTELYCPRKNLLLAGLPGHNYAFVSRLLERVELSSGEVLNESGEAFCYVYFPITCIISNLYFTEDGASSEVAMIGHEGMLGISVFLGGVTMPHQAVVVIPGYAYRLRKHQLEQEFKRLGGQRSGALNSVLLRFTQVLMTQMAQLVVCNRYHSIEQQLCRWLLLILDRQSTRDITITQQSIATLLGVRREGVTKAAGELQQAGLIRYSRGQISVLNRAGLEARVCECYQVVTTEFDRLRSIRPLPSPRPNPITAINLYGNTNDIGRYLPKEPLRA